MNLHSKKVTQICIIQKKVVPLRIDSQEHHEGNQKLQHRTPTYPLYADGSDTPF